MINKKWDIVLKEEMKKEYFKNLGIFVKNEYKNKNQDQEITIKEVNPRKEFNDLEKTAILSFKIEEALKKKDTQKIKELTKTQEFQLLNHKTQEYCHNYINNNENNLLVGEMENLKKEIEKLILKFKVKTGAGDKMFGQISVKQIKKELENNGYNIDKTKILLDHPITCLGMHNVDIELHKEVTAVLKINVSKE